MGFLKGKHKGSINFFNLFMVTATFLGYLMVLPLIGGVIAAVTVLPGCDSMCSTTLNAFPTVIGLMILAGFVVFSTRPDNQGVPSE